MIALIDLVFAAQSYRGFVDALPEGWPIRVYALPNGQYTARLDDSTDCLGYIFA